MIRCVGISSRIGRQFPGPLMSCKNKDRHTNTNKNVVKARRGRPMDEIAQEFLKIITYKWISDPRQIIGILHTISVRF